MKKIFLFLSFFVFESVAKATEITNPFYISPKGILTSTTELSYQKSRTNEEFFGNNFRARNRAFSQRFEYGIAPKVAVVGNIANTWQRQRPDNGLLTDKTDSNVDWSVGGVYDFYNKDDAHLHLEVLYLQKETHHFRGAYKALHANGKAGYDLEWFLPYLGGQIELPIAQRKDSDNDLKYDSYAGLYKDFADLIALDTTVHYGFNHYTKSTYLTGRADLSFFIKDTIARGGFFDYTFLDHAKNHARTNGHTIGGTVKFQF